MHVCVGPSIRWFQFYFPPAMRVRGTSTYPSGSGDQDLESTPIDTATTQPQNSIQRTKTAPKKNFRGKGLFARKTFKPT